jgi:hypothetical protein
MKTVKITEPNGFDAYPHGKKVHFVHGQEVDVADHFADLIIAKGHAKEVEPQEPDAARKKR